MIPLIIFYLHIVGFIAAFVSEYQKEGVASGFLTIGFMTLIFSVGWTISSFILRQILDIDGINYWLTRDSISLLLLCLGEILFYFFYFFKRQTSVPHNS